MYQETTALYAYIYTITKENKIGSIINILYTSSLESPICSYNPHTFEDCLVMHNAVSSSWSQGYSQDGINFNSIDVGADYNIYDYKTSAIYLGGKDKYQKLLNGVFSNTERPEFSKYLSPGYIRGDGGIFSLRNHIVGMEKGYHPSGRKLVICDSIFGTPRLYDVPFSGITNLAEDEHSRLFLLVSADNKMYYSKDLVNWTEFNLSVFGNENIKSVYYIKGRFIVITVSGKIYYKVY